MRRQTVVLLVLVALVASAILGGFGVFLGDALPFHQVVIRMPQEPQFNVVAFGVMLLGIGAFAVFVVHALRRR